MSALYCQQKHLTKLQSFKDQFTHSRRFKVRPVTSDIRITCECIRLNTDDMRVHMSDTRMPYKWHTDNIQVHTSDYKWQVSPCEYIRVTIRWHTTTYELHTNDIRVHTDNLRAHTSNIRVHTNGRGVTYEYIRLI